MVTPQATQSPQDSSDESVRITAAMRKQILREHYEERYRLQQLVAQSQRVDRNALGPQEAVFSTADLRVSNAVAVLQDISSVLAALDETRGNRDFRGVAR